MAFPFEQMPMFSEYLEWARQQGCKVQNGHNENNRSIHRIDAPDGKFVHSVGLLHHERLTPTQIANFDRRLGLSSEFPKLEDF